MNELIVTGEAMAVSGREAITGFVMLWFATTPAANVASGYIRQYYDPCRVCYHYQEAYDSRYWTGLW